MAPSCNVLTAATCSPLGRCATTTTWRSGCTSQCRSCGGCPRTALRYLSRLSGFVHCHSAITTCFLASGTPVRLRRNGQVQQLCAQRIPRTAPRRDSRGLRSAAMALLGVRASANTTACG
eukprot:1058627-Prorocentrum_minimum.AAC.2